MTAADHWTPIVEALEAGAVDGADRGPFERHETHGSVVLVSDRVAYKLKKPVEFDFLDYRTVEQRGRMCRLEVELNRRLAPEIYVESASVCASGDGFRLGDEADAALEWLVAMRPIAPEAMLHHRVNGRQVTDADLRRVGHTLAGFHLGAARADPRLASPDEISRQIEERFGGLRDRGTDILDRASLESAWRFARCWLDRHGDRLTTRAHEGWVRDGHGDLRLEHIALRGERVEAIDCVEFDPALRAGDVLNDLAFLVMELELAERNDLVAALTDAWSNAGGPLEEDVMWFFSALKALVRVEVAVLRAAQLEAGYRREVVVDIARSHLALACRLGCRAHGPHLIAIGGLSGSGKTAVSRRLADLWGIDRLGSDETRKLLVGIGRDELAPDHAYENRVSEAVYEHLGRAAGELLAGGHAAVVDATFRRRDDRGRFLAALASSGSGIQPIAFELRAGDDVLRTRVRDRTERGGSDADIAVLEAQIAESDAAGSLPGSIAVQAGAPLEDVLVEIELAVIWSLRDRSTPISN